MKYKPSPQDTTAESLSRDIRELTELLARNTHEIWARQRMGDGWQWGPQRDDGRKEHPGLIPYDELTEEEKEYDRATAMETLKLIQSLGYRIEKARQDDET